VRAGDTILEIDGQPTEEIDLVQSVELMRGQPGTQVALKLLPYSEQQPRDVTLTRQIIPVQSVYGDTRHPDGTWNFVLEQYPQIGYVRIISFGDATPEELKKALQVVLPNVSGLVLDLRGNAGGLLEAAVATCDMFLPKGNIVSIKSRGGRAEHRFQAKSGNVIVRSDLVVAVLVDGYSASASEIVAACLQDHHRACLIGQRSWGKGTVQRVIELEGGRSALKLTTATYWRPSGTNIHRSSNATEQDAWGVQPDPGYEVKLDEDQYLRFLRSRRQRDAVPLSATRPSAPGNSGDDAVETGSATASPATSGLEASAEGTAETGLYDPQLERAIQYILEKTNPQARLDAA
jgi:carboxyl-terminal processing protease